MDDQTDSTPMDSSESDADIQDHLAKEFSGIADMYWVLFFLSSCFSPVKVHGFFIAV